MIFSKTWFSNKPISSTWKISKIVCMNECGIMKVFFCFDSKLLIHISGKSGVISFMILCTSCNSIGSHDRIKLQLHGVGNLIKIWYNNKQDFSLKLKSYQKSTHLDFKTIKFVWDVLLKLHCRWGGYEFVLHHIT